MCDFSTITALLVAASVALIAGSILIASAAVLNAGFFTAFSAIAVTIAATACAATAAASLAAAAALLNDFRDCFGPAYGGCWLEINALRNSLAVLATATGALAVMCGFCIFASGIPFAGAGPLIAIGALMAAQLATLRWVNVDLDRMMECVNRVSAMPIFPGYLLTLFGIATLTIFLSMGAVLGGFFIKR